MKLSLVSLLLWAVGGAARRLAPRMPAVRCRHRIASLHRQVVPASNRSRIARILCLVSPTRGRLAMVEGPVPRIVGRGDGAVQAEMASRNRAPRLRAAEGSCGIGAGHASLRVLVALLGADRAKAGGDEEQPSTRPAPPSRPDAEPDRSIHLAHARWRECCRSSRSRGRRCIGVVATTQTGEAMRHSSVARPRTSRVTRGAGSGRFPRCGGDRPAPAPQGSSPPLSETRATTPAASPTTES
jgi:hypothetical protein